MNELTNKQYQDRRLHPRSITCSDETNFYVSVCSHTEKSRLAATVATQIVGVFAALRADLVLLVFQRDAVGGRGLALLIAFVRYILDARWSPRVRGEERANDASPPPSGRGDP